MAVAPAPVDARALEHHVLDFLAYLEFERGLSRNTLEAYRSDLLQFGAYLKSARVDVLEAQHADLAGFLDTLAQGAEGRPAARPATLQRKAACLRSFYRHLRRENAIQHDPTADLRAPRKSQKLPNVLSRGDVDRLLRAPKGTEPGALRDRALLELMYARGLRARRRPTWRWATSTSRRECCARAARAPRSGSSRSAARRSPPCASTWSAGARC
jgi:integrase/recombinase XerD